MEEIVTGLDFPVIRQHGDVLFGRQQPFQNFLLQENVGVAEQVILAGIQKIFRKPEGCDAVGHPVEGVDHKGHVQAFQRLIKQLLLVTHHDGHVQAVPFQHFDCIM